MDAVSRIEAEAAALVAAARLAPDAPVPTCPGWTATDLVAHTGGAHRWALDALRAGTVRRPEGEPPPEQGVFEWFEEGVALLVDALGSVDPSAPTWTFDRADRTATFWHRRELHETTVHRVDAQLAAGMTPDPVEPEVAADGVDEVLRVFVPMAARRGKTVPATGRTVHLHATDADGEWLVTLDGVPTVTTGHAKGDAALRGPAESLYLWVWGRPAIAEPERFGDEGALADLRGVATF